MTPLAEKLEALRRHAASARKLGNVAEADAFDAAAARIEAKLPAETSTSAPHAAPTALAEDADALFWTDLPMETWPWHLAVRVAEACGVDTIAHDTSEADDPFFSVVDKPARWRASFFGRIEHRRAARVLFEELKRALVETMRSQTFRSERAKRSFAIGFADAVGKMIRSRDPSVRAAALFWRREAQRAARKFATPLQAQVKVDVGAFHEGVRAAKRR